MRPYLLKRLASPRVDRPLLGILALALVLNLIGITWGLPGTASWNADSIAGTLVLKVWHSYTVGFHKYPYLHFWISFLVYLPFVLLWLATGRLDGGCWPFLNPNCFEDPAAQMGLLILLSRLISVAMGLGLVLAVHRIAGLCLASRRAARIAALATALCYASVFYAHLGNLDLPMTFWYGLSLVAFLRILQRGARADYLGFGLLSGAALGTKEGIIGAYVLVGLLILWTHLELPGAPRPEPDPEPRPPRPRSPDENAAAAVAEVAAAEVAAARAKRAIVPEGLARLFDARMRALVLGLLLVYLLSTNAVFNFAGFVEHWRQWLPGNERMDGFRGQVEGWTPVLTRLWSAMQHGMGLPLLLLCLAGIPIALRETLRRRSGSGTGSLAAGGLAPESAVTAGAAVTDDLLADDARVDDADADTTAAAKRAHVDAGAAASPRPHAARRVDPLWLLIPVLSYILFTILPARMANVRLVLPMLPSLAVFGALAAERLLQLEGSALRRGLGLALVGLALSHAGLLSLRHDLLFLSDARYEAEDWLRSELPKDASVLYFSDTRYLPRFELLGIEAERVPPEADYRAELEARRPDFLLLSDRWYERFDSGVNADADKKALIQALLAGEGGYEVVWHSRQARPWWRDIPDEAKASPSVDPWISILRRRP